MYSEEAHSRGQERGRGRGCVRARIPSVRPELPAFERPAYLSVPQGRLDSVSEHIERFDLQLEPYGFVRSNGDCFYDSLQNLIQYHNVTTTSSNVVELRKEIANHVKKHPDFRCWKEIVFKNNGRLVNSFINAHSKPGTFTDQDGLIVLTAAHFLNVNLHVVSSSNNQQDPVTKFNSSSLITFHLGYRQDCTDTGGKAGHYRSFVPKIPLTPLPIPENMRAVQIEQKILDMLTEDGQVVNMAISRLKSIDMDFGTLKTSGILPTLMKVKELYPADSQNGLDVRQLLHRYNRMILAEKRTDLRCMDITIQQARL